MQLIYRVLRNLHCASLVNSLFHNTKKNVNRITYTKTVIKAKENIVYSFI